MKHPPENNYFPMRVLYFNPKPEQSQQSSNFFQPNYSSHQYNQMSAPFHQTPQKQCTQMLNPQFSFRQKKKQFNSGEGIQPSHAGQSCFRLNNSKNSANDQQIQFQRQTLPGLSIQMHHNLKEELTVQKLQMTQSMLDNEITKTQEKEQEFQKQIQKLTEQYETKLKDIIYQKDQAQKVFDQKEKKFQEEIQNLTKQISVKEELKQIQFSNSYKQRHRSVSEQATKVSDHQNWSGLLKKNEAFLQKLNNQVQKRFQRTNNINQEDNHDNFKQILKVNQQSQQQLKENLNKIEDEPANDEKRRIEYLNKKSQIKKEVTRKNCYWEIWIKFNVMFQQIYTLIYQDLQILKWIEYQYKYRMILFK